tara:strand:- start:188 stop:580 length:393 start_codon:yes stop_codon:yes gene_type:complete
MGDAGSNFLGFNLAITSIILLRDKLSVGILPFSLIIFFVPVFDMIKVISIRVLSGYSPFNADRNHIHFQLLRRDLSYKKVILTLYFLNLISIFVSLIFFDLKIALPLLISSVILALFFLCIFNKRSTFEK